MEPHFVIDEPQSKKMRKAAVIFRGKKENRLVLGMQRCSLTLHRKNEYGLRPKIRDMTNKDSAVAGCRLMPR